MADPTPEVLAARAKWRWTGKERPTWAEEPGPGQESVWDYPRPPRMFDDDRLVVVRAGERVVARSTSTVRVLETAGAPAFYIPPADVDEELLVEVPGSSICEWKGPARYWALRQGPREAVGWDYPDPFTPFEPLAGLRSFFPARLDCTVDGQRVRAQPGGFYGGWVTEEIVGPIKGEPGSAGW
ncbi:MAG: DUF427 domain-containing protein [Microthrixaceae bacterium]|nr:DUF427 domain-containing protein [Microthrixaceae bacterium]MCO5322303.1 DUF427 domain-containing protein [Microthrixaceae bacterium]